MNRSVFRQLLVGILCLTMLLGLATATGLASSVTVAIQRINTINPLMASGGYEYLTFRVMYEGLAVPGPDLALRPALATSWRVSDDGKIWTIQLREGVEWSDGTPFTAEDVVFTFTRAADPRTGSVRSGSFNMVKGLSEYLSGQADTIAGIRAAGPYVVEVEFDQPNYVWFVGFISHTPLAILPAHILKDVPVDEFERAPYFANPNVTLGPYVFQEFRRDQYIRLTRNEKYWAGVPHIEEVTLRIAPTVDGQIAMMLSGEADLTTFPVLELPTFDGVPGIRIERGVAPGPVRIAIGYAQPYLQDARVRRAFAMAIDREAIVAGILGGEGVVPTSDFSPYWEAPDLEPLTYDPRAARALLEEAGWDFNQKVTLIWIPGQRDRDLAARVIQQQLQEIGVQLELQQVDLGAALESFVNETFDLYLYGGGIFRLDPSIASGLYESSTFYPGGGNLGHYSNPEVDRLFQAGRSTNDEAERRAIYHELSKKLVEETPHILLYLPNVLYAVNEKLEGFEAHGVYELATWNISQWRINR